MSVLLRFFLVFILSWRGHGQEIEMLPVKEERSSLLTRVIPTAGQPWPKPQLLANYGKGYMVVRPAIFRFEPANAAACPIVDDALKRYYSILLKSNPLTKEPKSSLQEPRSNNEIKKIRSWKNSTNFHGYLDILNMQLMGPCENYPHENMDESYEIKIDSPDLPGKGILVATSNWGILRGLETFLQLIFPSDDLTSIKSTLIVDYPRFSFRSVLIDTARHFISKKVMYQNLDLMSMNKYNVLHWHIVDDQAFPYQSKTFPQLSDKGAYHPFTHVYTQKDVADVIEYARLRGIRVVPEFDTPGHTQAWGNGQEELLTPCYNKDGVPDGTYGPIDPTRETNYAFLKKLFQEVSDVFQDKFIHLGGDEVDFSCWESNPQIMEFMQKENMTEYTKVEEYYMQRLVNIVQSFPKNNSYLVWQEVFDNDVNIDKNTIVHVWKGALYQEELALVTARGYRAILSSPWYLNFISYGIDWQKYYECDPHDFEGTEAQKQAVIGGGAAMWAEYVDSTNLIPRLWPRAAVPAERLWSSAKTNNTREAAPRLEEHRCRLLRRGFQVEPVNGPGYCLVTWD